LERMEERGGRTPGSSSVDGNAALPLVMMMGEGEG